MGSKAPIHTSPRVLGLKGVLAKSAILLNFKTIFGPLIENAKFRDFQGEEGSINEKSVGGCPLLHPLMMYAHNSLPGLCRWRGLIKTLSAAMKGDVSLNY